MEKVEQRLQLSLLFYESPISEVDWAPRNGLVDWSFNLPNNRSFR